MTFKIFYLQGKYFFIFFVENLRLSSHSISVVIPNYNGVAILTKTIPTLYEALHFSGAVFEIIICDDASTDESVHFIKTKYPEILLTLNKHNSGFSPTINKGIFKARHDLVFLLNNDVKLERDYFIHLFRYFESEDTFGVMGRIIGWEDDLIQDGAKYPRMQGFKIKTNGNYISLNPQKEDWLYSIYLSGANALVDRKKLLLIGGFDEIFAPFYVEDYELSIRAWRIGWKCYYEHFSVCRHATSITIKKKSSKRFIKTIYNRNKMLLHAIHLSGAHLIFWYVSVFFEAVLRLLSGQWFYLKAVYLFLCRLNKVQSSRFKINKAGKATKHFLSLSEVFHIFKATLSKLSIRKF